MPGVAAGLPLHSRMLAQGYTEAARECAMYRSLEDFALPPEIKALETRLAADGCTVQDEPSFRAALRAAKRARRPALIRVLTEVTL